MVDSDLTGSSLPRDIADRQTCRACGTDRSAVAAVLAAGVLGCWILGLGGCSRPADETPRVASDAELFSGRDPQRPLTMPFQNSLFDVQPASDSGGNSPPSTPAVRSDLKVPEVAAGPVDVAPLSESATLNEPLPMIGPLGSPTIAGELVDRELASIPVPSSFADVRASPTKAMLEQGAALLGQGKTDLAIHVFYKVLDVDPANAQAFESLGQCYISKNELSKAVANLDSAIRLNPKSTTAYVARASANTKLRYVDRALDDLTTALKLDPKNVAALTWRSIAYINEGRSREARADCDAVLKLNSGVLDAYVVRCLANLQLRDPNAARVDYRAAVSRGLHPESVKMLKGWFAAFGQAPPAPAGP
ncbi:MAG TPA: tetratricopeptide repeat protein [Pirellulales bacterium]